jgi:hypothetical protein
MQLELAENNADFPYVFVPLRDGSGLFVHNNKLDEMLSKKGKGKGKLKKIALSPARNAFLGLVKLNAKGLAKKLAKAIAKDENKVKDFWVKKLGGNFNKLKTAIAVGSKRKALGNQFEPLSGPEVIAFLAAAAPIIAAIVPLLKSIIGKEGGSTEDGSDLLTDIEKNTGEKMPPDPTDPQHADKYDKDEDKGGIFGIPTPVLIGGGLLAAFLLLRKK